MENVNYLSTYNQDTQEFSDLIEEIIKKPSSSLVQQAGRWVAEHPEHSLELQVKLIVAFRRNLQLDQKIQLLYVLHEFLKSWKVEDKADLQTEWFNNVNEAIVQCTKTKTFSKLEKVGKVLSSWEKRNIFLKCLKNWKQLVGGTLRSKNTHNDPLLPEEEDTKSNPSILASDPLFFDSIDDNEALKQLHYRYSGIHFIVKLADKLELTKKKRTVSTALVFYHKMFSSSIDPNERYKIAAACLFVATKAESSKTKLYRVVREMCSILGNPLVLGDEEVEEYHRRVVLRYEMDVLQGIGYDLNTQHPYNDMFEALHLNGINKTDVFAIKANECLLDCLHTCICLDNAPKMVAALAIFLTGQRSNEKELVMKCVHFLGVRLSDVVNRANLLRDYYDWKYRQEESFYRFKQRAGDKTFSPCEKPQVENNYQMNRQHDNVERQNQERDFNIKKLDEISRTRETSRSLRRDERYRRSNSYHSYSSEESFENRTNSHRSCSSIGSHFSPKEYLEIVSSRTRCSRREVRRNSFRRQSASNYVIRGTLASRSRSPNYKRKTSYDRSQAPSEFRRNKRSRSPSEHRRSKRSRSVSENRRNKRSRSFSEFCKGKTSRSPSDMREIERVRKIRSPYSNGRINMHKSHSVLWENGDTYSNCHKAFSPEPEGGKSQKTSSSESEFPRSQSYHREYYTEEGTSNTNPSVTTYSSGEGSTGLNSSEYYSDRSRSTYRRYSSPDRRDSPQRHSKSKQSKNRTYSYTDRSPSERSEPEINTNGASDRLRSRDRSHHRIDSPKERLNRDYESNGRNGRSRDRTRSSDRSRSPKERERNIRENVRIKRENDRNTKIDSSRSQYPSLDEYEDSRYYRR